MSSVQEFVSGKIIDYISQRELWVLVQVWHDDPDKIYIEIADSNKKMQERMDSWISMIEETEDDNLKIVKKYSSHYKNHYNKSDRTGYWWFCEFTDGTLVSLDAKRVY